MSAYQLGRACTQTFTDSTTAIDQLQTNLVYDHSVKYPMEITVPVDIKTWKLEDTTYSIQTKNIADENFNFFRQRRKGLLRNKIIKV